MRGNKKQTLALHHPRIRNFCWNFFCEGRQVLKGDVGWVLKQWFLMALPSKWSGPTPSLWHSSANKQHGHIHIHVRSPSWLILLPHLCLCTVLAQFPAASEAQTQLSALLCCTAKPSPCWTNAADGQLACPVEHWVKADVLMKCSVSSCRRHSIGKEAATLCDEAVAKVTTFFLLEKSRVNKHVNRLKSHVNCWWTYSGYLDDKVSLFQDLNFLWRIKNIICCDLRQLQLDNLTFRYLLSFCIALPCRVWRHPFS